MTQRRRDGSGREFSGRDSVRIALYGYTGLPIIVAVTSVAVSAGQMSEANSSLLVAGGAVTVLLLPMAATLLQRPEPDREPNLQPQPDPP
jgi:hypothetical protein